MRFINVLVIPFQTIQTNGTFWLVLGLLLGCKQVPIASISISDPQSIQVSVTDCKLLGSVSSMGGSKQSFILQCKGAVSNPKAQGHLGIIGLAGNATLDAKSPTLTKAIKCKDEAKKLLWQENGDFIFWNKKGSIDKEIQFIIKVEEDTLQKIASASHNIYMVYADQNAFYRSNAPVQVQINDKPCPDYKNIQLQATNCILKPTSAGVGWLLKGSITAGSYKEDTKVGFLLVKEGLNPNSHELVQKILVQKIVAGGNSWPVAPTAFSDHLIIVPAALTQNNHIIEGQLLSNQTPIKSGDFKIFCYLIENNHCYISQMEHVLSKSTPDPLTTNTPPSVSLHGSSYSLTTSNLNVSRIEASDQMPTITFSDFQIQYITNNQIKQIPSNLQACLLFFKRKTMWETTTIESLFKDLHTSNRTACMTDDATLCIVTNGSKQLDPSCIDFFSKKNNLKFLTCLFSTEDFQLQYYTESQEIKINSVQKKEILQPEIVKETAKETYKQIYKEEIKLLKIPITFNKLPPPNTIANKCYIIVPSEALLSDQYEERNKELVQDYIQEPKTEPISIEGRLLFKEGGDEIDKLIEKHARSKKLSIRCRIQLTDKTIMWSEYSAPKIFSKKKGWLGLV